ncbi:MAG: hypothetical protein HGA85_03800 [Nanoarchaeota archaeon]|nr:hypothetical protein [Nanoarchaeota archaeon]
MKDTKILSGTGMRKPDRKWKPGFTCWTLLYVPYLKGCPALNSGVA